MKKKDEKPRKEECAVLLANRAEQAVIGVLLIAPKSIERIVSLLQSEDFEDARYRAVFNAGKRLQEQGKPVDSVTLLGEMRLRVEMDGRAAQCLSEAAVAVPHTRHLAQYCELVKEASRKRRLVVECEKCLAAVMEGKSASEAFGAMMTSMGAVL